MSQNRTIQRRQTLEGVLNRLVQDEGALREILPGDLPFDKFASQVKLCLLQNLSILDATVNSIFKACMKAAYDGCRLDGREAVLVVHENTYGRGKDERKVLEAEYFPMVYGLIQRVLKGGEVKSINVDVIYEHDTHTISLGSNPHVHHVPNLLDDRGRIIGAYSVATFPDGSQSIEIASRADLTQGREAAKTKKVWDKWSGEMSKKFVFRRHQKRLPAGDRDITIDAEARELYGEFEESAPALADASRAAPRPTRAAISNQNGTEAGQAMDFEDEGGGVTVDHDTGEQRTDGRRDYQGQNGGKGQHATESEKPADLSTGGDTQLPDDEDQWILWQQEIERKIDGAADIAAIETLETEEKARIDAAPKERADWIKAAIVDRKADLAAGADEGEGQPVSGDDAAQQGTDDETQD